MSQDAQTSELTMGASLAPLASGSDRKKASAPSTEGLGFVLDVPIELTVEIGRKTLKISEVLAMGPGSILELDKASGEPLDVLLNNRCVARGEAVVIGDRYGVRITEVFAMDEKRGGAR